MVVGFDTRFLSDRYAIEVARVLAANGITVHLTHADAPTPVVSFAVKQLGVQGGVMITASHNPPRYNGIKLKASLWRQRIERRLPPGGVSSGSRRRGAIARVRGGSKARPDSAL